MLFDKSTCFSKFWPKQNSITPILLQLKTIRSYYEKWGDTINSVDDDSI